MPFYRSELLGKDPIWLLRVDWRGRSYYFSSRPAAPIDADGDVLEHKPQLADLRLDGAFNLLTDDPGARSLSVEVDLGFDVAAAIAAGADLQTARAEVSLWIEGTAYEKRQKMLFGDVLNPSYGAQGEPINFAIEEQVWNDRSSTLPASHRINDSLWSKTAESAQGQYYPLVFGAPGVFTTANQGTDVVEGSPAFLVNYDAAIAELVIAGHRVAATTVKIICDDGTYDNSVPVTHREDGLGQLVAIVNIHSTSITKSQTAKYWAVWSNGNALKTGEDQTLTGAGELLEYFLERTTIGVDRGRLAAVKDHLNGLQLSGYIDDPSSIYDWLLDNLLPLLPVTMVRNENGLYPILWRPQANRSAAVEQLAAGEGLFRSSMVTYVGEIQNTLSIEYALNANTNTYHRIKTLGPRRATDQGADYLESLSASVSANTFGQKIGDQITTDIITSSSSALWVLSWQIQAHAFPKREILYDADLSFAWLEDGAQVTITDSDLGLYNTPAIWSSVWDQGRLSARLLILSNPNIDTGDRSG